jgi:catalase
MPAYAVAEDAPPAATSEAAEDPTTPDQLIDALNALFGKNPGKRAAHTSGICLKGSFAPTAEAPNYTKAPHFAAPVPVTARFSMGGGNPAAPNTQKDNARGLAVHFNLPDGGTTDMVMISAPVFVVKTPAEFLTLLQTVATKDKDKIDAFFKAHPDSTRQAQWLKARPVPASYATATYFGVHTFTLTNAKGESRIIKWQMVPVGGDVGLSDAEVKDKAPDFYTPELTERLAAGPAKFNLFAVLGQPGDATDDPTALWPDDRKTVNMGTLTISSIEPNETCDAGIFDPTNVVDGIEGPQKDLIFPMRSAAYAVSFSRRTN